MKLRSLLMTLTLSGCSLAGFGQTVSIDGAPAVNVNTLLTESLLTGVEKIKLEGTWDDDAFSYLKDAINSGYNNEAQLKEVDMNAVTLSGSQIDYIASLFEYCTQLTKVTFPVAESAVSMSMKRTFYQCKKLTTIVNLDKLTRVTDFSYAFTDNSLLTSVTLPAGNGGTTLSFSNAFNNCTALTEVKNLGMFKASIVLTMFTSCPALKSVDLPEPSESIAAFDMNALFSGCSNLTSIGNLDKYAKVNNLKETFKDCQSLTYINLPEVTTKTSISFEGTFSGCEKLRAIANLEKFSSISSQVSMFYGCSSLTYVKLAAIAPSRYLGKTFQNCNPNCLVYTVATVNPAAAWGTTVNFIKDGAAYNNLTLTDGKPFYCPEAFALADKTITYTRSFGFVSGGNNGWNTLCLPFNAQLKANDVVIPYFKTSTDTEGRYWLKSYTNSAVAGAVSFDYATSEGQTALSANTPYLIALPGNALGSASLENNVLSFTATGIEVPATPAQVEISGTNYTFKGSYSVIEKSLMYLLTHPANEDGKDYFIYYQEGNLNPFRAYFTANNEASKVNALSINGGSGTTGLVMPQNEPEQCTVTSGKGYIEITSSNARNIRIVTVDGRTAKTVSANVEPIRVNLAPGLYVADGKKVIVR